MTFSLRTYGFLIAVFLSGTVVAQDTLNVTQLDSKYREDQFYVGITYNLLTKVPSNLNLDGVSGGVNFGFLRDMPINEQRNIAIAVGAGIAFDRYGQNLFIGEEGDNETIFRPLVEGFDFNTNRLSTAALEVPLEFRWRTSTSEVYKFWRIYTGIRMGYTYWYRAFFSQTNNEVGQTDIPEFQRLNFATTLSFGYGTFNFYVNYSLTPFFKDAYTQDTLEEIGFSPLKIGIILYIL